MATLASLAYETTEQDEVLILAAPGEVGREAETLAANLGTARFVVRRAGRPAAGWTRFAATSFVICTKAIAYRKARRPRP